MAQIPPTWCNSVSTPGISPFGIFIRCTDPAPITRREIGGRTSMVMLGPRTVIVVSGHSDAADPVRSESQPSSTMRNFIRSQNVITWMTNKTAQGHRHGDRGGVGRRVGQGAEGGARRASRQAAAGRLNSSRNCRVIGLRMVVRRSVIECQPWHQLRGHELTQPVGPAYFLTLLALALRPVFRPSPIFLASSLRTAAYFGATIG